MWGQSLCQSLFLISALQRGNSASNAKLWRIWCFCGEGCLKTSVSAPCFLSSSYISSRDLPKGHCLSKTKPGGREPGDQKSQLSWGFFPHYFDFLGGSNVGTQHRDTELYCSSFHVSPQVPVQVDLLSWCWLCAHVWSWVRCQMSLAHCCQELLWTTSSGLWAACFEWVGSLAASGLELPSSCCASPVVLLLVGCWFVGALQQDQLWSPVLSLLALPARGHKGRTSFWVESSKEEWLKCCPSCCCWECLG